MGNDNLKNAGLKITTPRLRILEILERAQPRHVSAEDIYRALSEAGEEIGIATVYRVLTQFEEAGLVARHNFEEGFAVFEINQGEHHDHLVCIKCGKVEEFVDEVIEARQKAIAEKHSFNMTDHVLHIYGVCSACKK